MYYYSKKSREKIIHTAECFHINRIGADDIGWFETLPDAYVQGYRLCKHCSPLLKCYRKEHKQILDFCRKNGLAVRIGDKRVFVESNMSKWQIILDKSNEIALYHKNSFKTSRDSLSEVCGYHFQGDIRKNSIAEYLEYIIEHDHYRRLNPAHTPKKESPPPIKGTKRYKSTQRKIRKYERKQAIRNVLSLIDSLSVPTTQKPAMAM